MGARRIRRVIGAVLVTAVLTVGALLFQPWQILVDRTVDDAAPDAVADAPTAVPSVPAGDPAGADATPTPERTAAASPPPSASPAPRTVTVLATGTLVSHEHATTGEARLLRLPDGRRVLRLEGLRTSSGPDLRVWLSAGPVREGRAGWFVFSDHPYVDLGRLRGNRGNQNYAVPADIDLDDFSAVSIWCRRFRVSFGAAELA